MYLTSTNLIKIMKYPTVEYYQLHQFWNVKHYIINIYCMLLNVMHNRWCHAAAARKRGFFYLLSRVKSAVASITSCCAENDIISLSWKAVGFYLWSEIHTHSRTQNKEIHTTTHANTKPQVYDRWRRLIASALHHEWQQEVMNALLYGGRGN